VATSITWLIQGGKGVARCRDLVPLLAGGQVYVVISVGLLLILRISSVAAWPLRQAHR
jgi:hypothetical protein